MAHWRRQLRPFCMHRRDMIAAYAGSRYSEELGFGLPPKILVNLIQLTAMAYSVALAYNRPRYKLTTFNPANRQFAKQWQHSLNTYVARLKLERIVREIVLDAFFWQGIGKTYGGDEPFARVSPDDFVIDCGGGHPAKAAFICDRYRVPLEEARADERFDPREAKKLEPSRKAERLARSEQTESLTTGIDDDEGEIEPMVDLVDVCLPRDGMCYTWPVMSNFEIFDRPPLGGVDESRDMGPYSLLNFITVPDNALPTSPCDAIYDLFLLFNGLFRKLAIRAKKLRDIPIYKPGGEEDLRNLMRAEDLQAMKVNDKENVGLMRLFNLDQQLNAFTFSVMEVFKQGSGNLDAMIGLAPTAETASQSAEISQKVGERQAHYRNRTNEFMSEVGTYLGDHMFHSRDLVVPGTQRIGSTEISVDATWYPPHIMERAGLFEDYEINVEPYSMEYTSPMARLARTNEQLQMLLPVTQQQGIPFNAPAYLEYAADLSDSPELLTFFNLDALPQQPLAGDGQVAQSNQPHEYIRRNVSQGPTNANRLQMLMQQTAGSDGGGGGDSGMSVS